MGHGINEWERMLVKKFGKEPSNIATPTIVWKRHTLSDAYDSQKPLGEYANFSIRSASALVFKSIHQACSSSCDSSVADRDIEYQFSTRDDSYSTATDNASSMEETQHPPPNAEHKEPQEGYTSERNPSIQAKQIKRPKSNLITTASTISKSNSPAERSNYNDVQYTTNAFCSDDDDVQAPQKHWNNRNKWYLKEYGDRNRSNRMNENRPGRRSNSYKLQHTQQPLEHPLSHLCYARSTGHLATRTLDHIIIAKRRLHKHFTNTRTSEENKTIADVKKSMELYHKLHKSKKQEAEQTYKRQSTRYAVKRANAKLVDRSNPNQIITAGPANRPDLPSSFSTLSNSSDAPYSSNGIILRAARQPSWEL